MEIHIAREGRQLGPFSLEDVQRMLSTGEVSAADLAWTPGSANWVPLNTIPGVVVPPAADMPPGMPPAVSPPSFQQRAPMAAPAAGAFVRQVRPTSGLAITSLVLGIVGLMFVPILASIPAVITGHMARAEIKRSEGDLEGDGMAVAGLITGYLSLIFWAILVVLLVVMLAAGVAIFPKLMNELNKLPADPAPVTNARIVAVACSSYASEHDGKFPMKLEDLVPDYLEKDDLESYAQSEFGGYEYIGGQDTDASDKVLFFSKRSNTEGKHIVARVSGAVALEQLPAELKERVPH
jgi:hypothetical protein